MSHAIAINNWYCLPETSKLYALEVLPKGPFIGWGEKNIGTALCGFNMAFEMLQMGFSSNMPQATATILTNDNIKQIEEQANSLIPHIQTPLVLRDWSRVLYADKIPLLPPFVASPSPRLMAGIIKGLSAVVATTAHCLDLSDVSDVRPFLNPPETVRKITSFNGVMLAEGLHIHVKVKE